MTKIDINFNVFTDTKRGGDPDKDSATLRKYHKLLWSKNLPSGKLFKLRDDKRGAYLYHKSEIGEFFLSSDAISHSYRNQKRKKWLMVQVQKEANELFDIGSTVGAYILFPGNKINNKMTINGARGILACIDDRFDLTLECIRRFYLGQTSPLFDVLLRYKDFFDLFEDFMGYVKFFLLQDLVDQDGNVKFYLPFNDFKSSPKFTDIDDYLVYKKKVTDFIQARSKRMEESVK